MSSPPPGAVPARPRIYGLLLGWFFVFLAVANIGTGVWVGADDGFVAAVTPLLVGGICLFHGVRILKKIHSGADRNEL